LKKRCKRSDVASALRLNPPFPSSSGEETRGRNALTDGRCLTGPK
jgi:hypothetical protein